MKRNPSNSFGIPPAKKQAVDRELSVDDDMDISDVSSSVEYNDTEYLNKFPVLPLSNIPELSNAEIIAKRNEVHISRDFISLKEICLGNVVMILKSNSSYLSNINIKPKTAQEVLKILLDRVPEIVCPATAGNLLSVPSLESLEFSNANQPRLDSSVLQGLLKLISDYSSSSLKQIRMCKNYQLQDSHLSFFHSCTSLKELDFSNCHQLTDIGFMELWKAINIPEITHLSVRGCYMLSNQFISSFIEELKGIESKLQYLDISYCQYIEDSTLLDFLSKTPNIKTLKVDHAFGLTSKLFLSFPKSLSLSVLSLHGFPMLEDQAIIEFISNAKNLEEIYMSHCYRITSATIEKLSLSCKKLSVIDISHCDKVSNSAITMLGGNNNQSYKIVNFTNLSLGSESLNSFLSRKGKTIRSLSIGSADIEFSTLVYIHHFCPVLETLDISFCHKITYDNILQFIKKTIYLKKISLWGFSFNVEQVMALHDINPIIEIERFTLVPTKADQPIIENVPSLLPLEQQPNSNLNPMWENQKNCE